MALQVSVIGAGTASPELERLAEQVGRLLARSGCTVVCGGLGGVMAAVSRGVATEGGTAVGVLPGESRAAANPWVSVCVATGVGHARNLAVVASGDAVIAVGGAWGTASEIALARKLGRRVVVLGPMSPVAPDEGLTLASTPEEAVELAVAAARRGSCRPAAL